MYYVLARSRHISFDLASGMVDNVRRVLLNSTPAVMQSSAGHRTRKALTVLLDKLLARRVLSREDVNDILLEAVDHCEPDPQCVAPSRRYVRG